MRMTKLALQGLYDSSIAYGMKKALMSQHNKMAMETKIKQLVAETQELETRCEEMEANGQELESVAKEQDAKLNAAHLEEK